MKISVIIPTYNRVNSLKRVLTGLEKQTFPLDQFEVVVISDGSTDGTEQYLKQLDTPLHLVGVQQPNSGPASARNHGLRIAQGDIIVFLDDDVMPTPQLLQEHIRYFLEGCDQRVVLGPMISPTDCSLSPWVEWEQRMLVKQYDAMMRGDWAPTARQFYTGNSSAARHFLLQAGGFDPAFRRAEDVELAYRLAENGAEFIYNPQAVVYHYADRNFSSWLATPYAYGKNDVIFHQQKGQTWLLPTIRKEFQQRHQLTQTLTKTFLGRATASRIIIGLLKQLALINQKLGQERLTNLAYSGIFNLRYYQGVADQLGGKSIFFQKIVSVTDPAGAS